MPPIDEAPSFEPKPTSGEARTPKKSPGAGEPAGAPKLVSVTIDVAAGRVVKVEAVDGSAAPRELSREDQAHLKADRPTLEHAIEQAFEAGIACALGDGGAPEDQRETAESEDDAELSRMLLRSLIRRSAARRLLQHDTLDRAIAGTLIEQAADFVAAPAQSAAH